MANKKDGTDDNIHAGHRERVRRRFFADPEMRTFSPHEILEYLLFYGVQRKDTNELAHKLIRAFGSLSAVFDASIDDLLAFPELPERAACLIKSIIPIANAYMKDGKRNAAVIDSYSDILSFYNHSSLSLNPNEERVSAIFLDVGGRVKNFAEVSAGGASNVTVDIPKLYRYASACKASKVVVFHNHPGDTMYPSQGDLIATSVMIITLASLGVMLADHIIRGNSGKYFSFFVNNILDALTDVCSPFINVDAYRKSYKPFGMDDFSHSVVLGESECERLRDQIYDMAGNANIRMQIEDVIQDIEYAKSHNDSGDR